MTIPTSKPIMYVLISPSGKAVWMGERKPEKKTHEDGWSCCYWWTFCGSDVPDSTNATLIRAHVVVTPIRKKV